MDGFFRPAGLAFLVLAAPIIAMYMLKTRRPRQLVPSTFLWREATDNVTASRPWQRLRPNILLLLQLLALTALVVFFADPFRNVAGVAGDHLIIVIDGSGSMLSTDEFPDRMEAARRQAEELLDETAPGAAVSVLLAGPRPRVLVSSTQSRAEAARAIDGASATEGPAGFSEAFLLAQSLQQAGETSTIALISDGGLSREERADVPPGTLFHPVGESDDNLSLGAIEIGDSSGGSRAFVEVRNNSVEGRRVELLVEVDGVPLTSAPVDVPAGGSIEKAFDLGPTTGRLVAKLRSGDDLAADDRAYASLERPVPRRILLVTSGNVFLEQLVSQFPGATVEVDVKSRTTSNYDLIVYDGVKLPRKIEAPALFVAPATAPSGVIARGEIEEPAIEYIAGNSELMDQVDLSELAIARARDVSIQDSETLVGTRESPLIAVWEEEGLRRGWIGFDLRESNLPLQVAFPILGNHLVSWLTSSRQPDARFAGDPIDIAPVAGASEVRVDLPGGKEVRLQPGQRLEDTERAGFYVITHLAGGEVVSEQTLALSFPESESAIAPATVAAIPVTERGRGGEAARRSLGAWIAAGALALLLVEWWWGHGRPVWDRRPERSELGSA